jgi:hypothetical protein
MIGKWARNVLPGAETSRQEPRGDLLIGGPRCWSRQSDNVIAASVNAWPAQGPYWSRRRKGSFALRSSKRL